MFENYLKMSIKVLLRKKFFTGISLFGISFTILVLIIASSFLEHSLNPGGPRVNDDRTLIADRLLGRDSAKTSQWHSSPGYGFYRKYAKKMVLPKYVSVITNGSSYYTYVEGKKLNFMSKYTDADFWKIYKFNFLYGKPFTAEDNDAAQKVAVISEQTAEKYFGEKNVVGQFIDISGQFYKVIGVVENISVVNTLLHADMWIPVKTNQKLEDDIFGGSKIIVLANSPDDFTQIKNDFLDVTKEALHDPKITTSYVDEMKCELKTPFEKTFKTLTMQRDDFSGYTTNSNYIPQESGVMKVVILSSLVGVVIILFMLLPSINLVNINLSRMVERNSEIGVRKAFGASNNVLVGQFVTENIILTTIGGFISLVLSYIIIQIVNTSESIPHLELSINLTVFVAAFFICLLFGVLSGVYPAYKMSRMHPVEALRGGEK